MRNVSQISHTIGTRPAPTRHRRTIYFGGRVQGVGFRYTTQNIALQYDVRGYVRNLPDGRVELVMEGPDGETQNGFIRKIDSDTGPATGTFDHFSIRH